MVKRLDFDEKVDHLFVCKGWHFFNDMHPFFEALDRKNKYFFMDYDKKNMHSLSHLIPLRAKNETAIIYFSSAGDFQFAINKLLKVYKRFKFVRLFHGIIGPWAKIIRESNKLIDVVIAASELDAGFLRENSNYRIEIVGWPKGEAFYRKNQDDSIVPNSVVIASNWAKNRGSLKICDHINRLSHFQITFMLHPHIFGEMHKGRAHRSVNSYYRDRQFSKIDNPFTKIVSCPNGVFEHMKNKEILLGVISSSSFEWLLFNRPAIFLRKCKYLNFGPLLDCNKDIERQILDAIELKDVFSQRRAILRAKLMSHFDGQYHLRFNDLVSDLESSLSKKLVKVYDLYPKSYDLTRKNVI